MEKQWSLLKTILEFNQLNIFLISKYLSTGWLILNISCTNQRLPGHVFPPFQHSSIRPMIEWWLDPLPLFLLVAVSDPHYKLSYKASIRTQKCKDSFLTMNFTPKHLPIHLRVQWQEEEAEEHKHAFNNILLFLLFSPWFIWISCSFNFIIIL